MAKSVLSYLLSVCCALLLIVVCGGAPASSAKHAHAAIPPIRHVFVITLENKNFSATFGPGSDAPYLAQTLALQGALLTQYYGTGHSSLDNYIAMMGGQANTPQTSADCKTYADFRQTGTAPDGQAVGQGCVYPASVRTASPGRATWATWATIPRASPPPAAIRP
jgi:hypothetical protein